MKSKVDIFDRTNTRKVVLLGDGVDYTIYCQFEDYLAVSEDNPLSSMALDAIVEKLRAMEGVVAVEVNDHAY